MSMVAEALMLQVMQQHPKLRPLSWDEHIAHGHTPYRRDCAVCQQTMQQCNPHRKVPYPVGGVLSVDVAGPLIPAKDIGGLYTRWMLVGTLTWAVPAESDKLKVPEVPDAEGDEPQIDINPEEPNEGKEEEKALKDKEGEEGKEEGDEAQVRVWEEEEEEKGEKEGEKDPALPGGGLPPPPYLLPPPEKKERDPDPQPGGFDIKIFRLAAPMQTKTSKQVTKTTMEFLLKLKMDGFHVGRIHSDRGHEFSGPFRKWALDRGIMLTRTPGDDPRANGRVEVAVKSFKTHIRRLLKQAEVGSEMWPLAARYADALNRSWRIGDAPAFPPFLQEILVRRRTWRCGVFEPTVEKVKYLFPAPEEHGHWVQPADERPRVTKYVMRKATEPITNQKWVAIEKEVADALTTRRRLREKTTVRKMEFEEKKTEESQKEDEEKFQKLKLRLSRIIEEEMKLMVEDHPELAKDELAWIAKMKKMMEEPTEEDEILQTKVISSREVAQHWNEWLFAINEEVQSLLEEKQAMKKVTKKELEELQKKASAEGRSVEIIPSKLVFTVKAGPNGGKKKTRWVICGNYEAKKDSEQTFSSGADSAAFRIAVWAAARHQWLATVLDIKTAFLNAAMEQGDQEDILVVRPPALFTEKGYMAKDVFFLPTKAVYGLRRSPRLWGNCRDETMEDFEVQAEVEEKKEEFSPSTSSSRTKSLEGVGKGRWNTKAMGSRDDLRGWHLHLLFFHRPRSPQKKVSGDLENIQARRRVWRANSLSGNGSFKKNWRRRKRSMVCDPEVIYQRSGWKERRKGEGKKNSNHSWSSSHRRAKLTSNSWPSTGSSKVRWRSSLASHQVTPRPHVWREQDGFQRPQKPCQGHGAGRTDERVFEKDSRRRAPIPSGVPWRNQPAGVFWCLVFPRRSRKPWKFPDPAGRIANLLACGPTVNGDTVDGRVRNDRSHRSHDSRRVGGCHHPRALPFGHQDRLHRQPGGRSHSHLRWWQLENQAFVPALSICPPINCQGWMGTSTCARWSNAGRSWNQSITCAKTWKAEGAHEHGHHKRRREGRWSWRKKRWGEKGKRGEKLGRSSPSSQTDHNGCCDLNGEGSWRRGENRWRRLHLWKDGRLLHRLRGVGHASCQADLEGRSTSCEKSRQKANWSSRWKSPWKSCARRKERWKERRKDYGR